MTDQFDTAALRELAENATEYRNIDGTPNEMARWFAGHHDGDGKPFADGFSYVGGGFDGEIIAERMTAADAEFIAAFDPFAVVALLDRLERAETAIERAKSKHRMVTDDDEPYCLTCFQSPYGHAPWPCPTVAALDTGKETGSAESS